MPLMIIFSWRRRADFPCAPLPGSPAAVVVDWKMLMETMLCWNQEPCLTEVRKKVGIVNDRIRCVSIETGTLSANEEECVRAGPASPFYPLFHFMGWFCLNGGDALMKIPEVASQLTHITTPRTKRAWMTKRVASTWKTVSLKTAPFPVWIQG